MSKKIYRLSLIWTLQRYSEGNEKYYSHFTGEKPEVWKAVFVQSYTTVLSQNSDLIQPFYHHSKHPVQECWIFSYYPMIALVVNK